MFLIYVAVGLIFLFSLPQCNDDGGVQTKNMRKALTWKKIKHIEEFDIDMVGIAGGDPYGGDTDVVTKLPILAIKILDSPRPNYPITGTNQAMSREFYQGWSGGIISLTPPIKGSQITSLEFANKFCEKHCGKGFRMAEFHDGKYVVGMDSERFYGDTWPKPDHLRSGGWNFYAHGNIPDNTRFWIHINDKRSNCWDQD